MKKKLKIYCALLALVLIGVYVCKPFNIYTHTYTARDGETLILDSLTEEFATINMKSSVEVDSINGDTISTTTSWNVHFKPTLEVSVPVCPHNSATAKYLYSNIKGQSCLVEMQRVKLKVPMEKTPATFKIVLSIVCLVIPLYIWLLVIVLKVIYSVYKGEVFVTQLSKRMENAGMLLVAIWAVSNIVTWIAIWMLRKDVLLAYYEIRYIFVGLTYVVFGLVLMIVSQIILMGKDLKEEQELTI